jgi:tetratricopeptide (TPR) repeat protein
MMSKRWCFALVSLTAGCALRLPASYVEQLNRAEQAITRRDFSACAEAFERASMAAPSKEYRDEVLYRRAHCLFRADRDAEALAALRQLSASPGARQERAAFDVAVRELETTEDGPQRLLDTIVRFQNFGVARAGLDRLLVFIGNRSGADAQLALLQQLLPHLHEPVLREFTLFLTARWFEDHEQPALARERFEALIHDYPYPTGRHWDEASLRAAKLSLKLKEPQRAVDTLTRMLKRREPADIIGSYERRYAEAQFQLGVIYETTDRWQEAYAAYLRVTQEHPTSALRDDAAWQAARLAHQHGDSGRACVAARLLQAEVPGSAYTACLNRVCSEPAFKRGDACHTYLLEQVPAPE